MTLPRSGNATRGAGGDFRGATRRDTPKSTTPPVGINGILDRLTRVRKTGPDTWSACCPAHEDKGPSLSIRDADGKILLHCFTGCSVNEIAGAMGIDLADLFPPRENHGKPIRTPFPAMHGLETLHLEALVVLTVAKGILNGDQLSQQSRNRLLLAVERISAVHGAVKPQIRGAK